MADLSPLSLEVMELSERIDATYGEGAEIRTVLVAVEVETEDGMDIVIQGDRRPWVKLAFLDEAIATVEQERDALVSQKEDDDE